MPNPQLTKSTVLGGWWSYLFFICQVLDMSGEVAKLASDLQQAVNTVETDPSSPCDVDTNEITKSDAEENLVEMLTSDNKR